MFKDAPWVLTRSEPVLVDLIEAVGAHPIVMDAETHDRLVAGVSHAAFLLSVGYVLALSRRSDWPEASKLAAGGFRDMSRLAAGDPQLYAGVARTNRAHLVEQLDAITAELARLRRHLEADDPRLVELFEEAQAVRERWSRARDRDGETRAKARWRDSRSGRQVDLASRLDPRVDRVGPQPAGRTFAGRRRAVDGALHAGAGGRARRRRRSTVAACMACARREGPLDCGNSGTTMRLLAGLLAAQEFESELTGDESLSRRPMDRVVTPLREMGARASWPPLRVGGQGPCMASITRWRSRARR